jgi:hypothetical protein
MDLVCWLFQCRQTFPFQESTNFDIHLFEDNPKAALEPLISPPTSVACTKNKHHIAPFCACVDHGLSPVRNAQVVIRHQVGGPLGSSICQSTPPKRRCASRLAITKKSEQGSRAFDLTTTNLQYSVEQEHLRSTLREWRLSLVPPCFLFA